MPRIFFFLVCCLVLSACALTGKRGSDSAMAVYDFGLLPEAVKTLPPNPPLALEVRAPLWFDSMGIEYRLAYADGARLREYARARWVGPPAQLIQQRLSQQLGYSLAGQGQSRCLLRVEILEFSQVFASPEQSQGVLRGRVLLFDHARHPLAERSLTIEKPAPSGDSRGAVSALTAVVEQLALDMKAWQVQLAASGNPGGCASWK